MVSFGTFVASFIADFQFPHSDHYWPMDTVPVYYGDIKVTLLNDSHYPDWIVTEFMMQRVRTDGESSPNFQTLIFRFFSRRATFNEFFATSTLRRGQTSACQIHRRHSRASSERSGSASDQRRDRLSFTAARALDGRELSSRWTEFYSKSKSLITLTSSASFTS